MRGGCVHRGICLLKHLMTEKLRTPLLHTKLQFYGGAAGAQVDKMGQTLLRELGDIGKRLEQEKTQRCFVQGCGSP